MRGRRQADLGLGIGHSYTIRGLNQQFKSHRRIYSSPRQISGREALPGREPGCSRDEGCGARPGLLAHDIFQNLISPAISLSGKHHWSGFDASDESSSVTRNCITRYGHPRAVFHCDTTSPTPPGTPRRLPGSTYPP